jgi:hypothetical protein
VHLPRQERATKIILKFQKWTSAVTTRSQYLSSHIDRLSRQAGTNDALGIIRRPKAIGYP